MHLKMDFSVIFRRRSLWKNLYLQSYRFIGISHPISHEAIKSTGAEGRKLSKEELEERQRQLMGRSLPKRKQVEGVKKVVLVSSAKGGVGKSTIAVNLAVGMKQKYPNKEISLLDADVFGPSLPRMMNLDGEPELTKENLMIPLQNYGVKCMSLGFLVNSTSPVVWRGLMVMSAIQKLLFGTRWSTSDILVVDMPPGTGDTQLSFAQTCEVSAAIIVTTPSQVAIQDAIKGIQMFKKTEIPILGYVLNMASYKCPCCSVETPIHPQNHRKLQLEHDIPLLATIPVDLSISQSCDDGAPSALTSDIFNNVIDKVYTDLIE